MAKKKGRGVSRREFIKVTGGTALAAGVSGAFFLFPEKALAQQKTLKIMQWAHFVPAYDKWFDGVFCKEWGQKHNTNVTVDHVSLTEIDAHAAAEASAKTGHDLVMLLEPPSIYENLVIDHGEIYHEVERRHGKPVELAIKSTYDPKTKKYFAFSDSYVPDPGNWRKDLFSGVGYPNGPDTWEQLRDAVIKIRKKYGNPCGIGLSQELDTSMAMRALMWSYGGAVQDEEGSVTLNSKPVVESVKFMADLYKQAETPEVFSWDPSSNNRADLAGRVSYAVNAISITREAEDKSATDPQMAKMSRLIMVCKPPAGPSGRWASEHVMSCYFIWNFAKNQDGAKQFLTDLIDRFEEAFKGSEYYNFPSFPSTVPDLAKLVSNDPRAIPPTKYEALADALKWSTNIGHPGYATPAISEVFTSWVIPTMYARVARGQMSAEESVAQAEKEVKRIFAKWASA